MFWVASFTSVGDPGSWKRERSIQGPTRVPSKVLREKLVFRTSTALNTHARGERSSPRTTLEFLVIALLHSSQLLIVVR